MILQPIHAVLEIGDISKRYPEVTFISIGPNIKFPHTIRETVEISSMFFIYNLLVEVLKSIK
jgi:dipeptidase D